MRNLMVDFLAVVCIGTSTLILIHSISTGTLAGPLLVVLGLLGMGIGWSRFTWGKRP